jgi:hypothetical protein
MLSAHFGILLLTPVEKKSFFFFIVFFRTSIGTPWPRERRRRDARMADSGAVAGAAGAATQKARGLLSKTSLLGKELKACPSAPFSYPSSSHTTESSMC